MSLAPVAGVHAYINPVPSLSSFLSFLQLLQQAPPFWGLEYTPSSNFLPMQAYLILEDIYNVLHYITSSMPILSIVFSL